MDMTVKMDGSALDIGGTRARLYTFQKGEVTSRAEIWLPPRNQGESDLQWGQRRVEAITELVAAWSGADRGLRLPTACAGRKDPERGSVVLSFYGSPLPELVTTVESRTGVDLGPLLDDDVCAGWGHLASPRGGVQSSSPDTLVLTAGTGLAESLWVNGTFLDKQSYPRLSELGVEERLRAEAWRERELPLSALQDLVKARAGLGSFQRVVLSGRFAGVSGWPERLSEGISLQACPLEEAPALGALALARLSSN
jgi:hypothetical protein